MSAKQDKKLRKLAKRATESIQFRAVDPLNGIKETWSLEEREALAAWLVDDEAPRWGATPKDSMEIKTYGEAKKAKTEGNLYESITGQRSSVLDEREEG